MDKLTIAALIDRYQTDRDSPYHDVRFVTRQNYDSLCKQIARDHGGKSLADVRGRHIKRWHKQWSVAGPTRASGLVAMLRILFAFGSGILEDDECERLSSRLRHLRVPMPKRRGERILYEHVVALRAKAHEMGYHSVALAQSFQWDCILRQKDLIGEYVPLTEKRPSEIVRLGRKWVYGILWSEIDDDLILVHLTSKRDKEVTVDLKRSPMVLEELLRLAPGLIVDGKVNRDLLPRSGPVIVYEDTYWPYRGHQFKYRWRLIARAAGVPDYIFNMDSRAGAITAAILAGAKVEHVREAAAHSRIETTMGYMRGSEEGTAIVQDIRSQSEKRKA